MKINPQAAPLLCKTEAGICEMPEMPEKKSKVNIFFQQKPVHILYFTDPICSSCFGIEPQLRKLELEYGSNIEIEYRMGGLLPSWDTYKGVRIRKPSDVAGHWEEISAFYEMPIEGGVWLEDPLDSSYPPSIAFKAAQMQDKDKAILFLRKIREMVFFEKKNITRWKYLETAAKEVLLNPLQLKANYEGKAFELFQTDLNFARKYNVKGFPTLFFTDIFNNREILYGNKSYETFENTVIQLFPQALKNPVNTCWENLFGHYSSLTTKEFSVLSNQSKEETEIQLNNLYNRNKIGKVFLKNGTLWTRKNMCH